MPTTIRVTFTCNLDNKIRAIKVVREYTGMSLYDAKMAVEAGAVDVLASNLLNFLEDVSGFVDNLSCPSVPNAVKADAPPTLKASLNELAVIKDSITRKLLSHVVRVARLIDSRIPFSK